MDQRCPCHSSSETRAPSVQPGAINSPCQAVKCWQLTTDDMVWEAHDTVQQACYMLTREIASQLWGPWRGGCRAGVMTLHLEPRASQSCCRGTRLWPPNLSLRADLPHTHPGPVGTSSGCLAGQSFGRKELVGSLLSVCVCSKSGT